MILLKLDEIRIKTMKRHKFFLVSVLKNLLKQYLYIDLDAQVLKSASNVVTTNFNFWRTFIISVTSVASVFPIHQFSENILNFISLFVSSK
jgi:hypothetical protein